MIFFKKKKNIDEDIKMVKLKKKPRFVYLFKVVFFLVLIVCLYVIYSAVRFYNKRDVKIYEVTIGEIVNVDRHRGFIYRDEYVANCANDGYINFYVSNGERVKRGAFIYSINDMASETFTYEFNNNDKNKIIQNLNMLNNSISDIDFSNIYSVSGNLSNIVDEINTVKQFENVDIEKEINAKEKGYSRYAGLVSYIIDEYEDKKIEDFDESMINKYDNRQALIQKKEVKANDKIYKIIKNPEFRIAFDSTYDYDDFKSGNLFSIKFLYENVTAKGSVESFIGNDGKKHFMIKVIDYPERFIGKRIVDFEIENKKVNGYKIPIKSIISKNCYIIPKTMIEKDIETNENYFYKIGANGIRDKVICNISKEDERYYYISIDDYLAKLKYGDVLTNRYNDTYSLSEVVKLNGVYNMNKGFAVFKNVDIIDRTNEYAIIKKRTLNGISLYDHIALDASAIKEGDLISY